MSLTKATYSLIKGAPANVLDFGADASGTSDSAPAFQAALDSGAEKVWVPVGTYKIATPITITNSGQTLEGESDYDTRLIAYGAGLINIGNAAYATVEHVTLRNFAFYGEAAFSGVSYINVRLAFQTYFERLRYKFSKKAPTAAVVLLNNNGGTLENPTRVTIRDCYFDGDDYSASPAGTPTPICIWNTAGIQVLVDNTHIQDFEIGVKLGVNPAVDTAYYNAAYPNDHDFNDFYFLNNSRIQIGSRGYVTTNGRCFDVWEGGNVTIDGSTFYLNNNGPTPALVNQRVILFNSPTFAACTFTNNLVNANARADYPFEIAASAVVSRFNISGNSFVSLVGYKNLIELNSGATCSAVIAPDNYFSNPTNYGPTYYQANGAASPFELGNANNITFVNNDGVARSFSEFSGGAIGATYVIEFVISSGSVTLVPSASGSSNGIVVDGILTNITIQNGDTLIVNRSTIVADNRYYATLVRGGAKVMTTSQYLPTTAPTSPSAGQVYYDSGTNKLRCYNGSTWNDLF